MNEIDYITRLAKAADGEAGERIDVTRNVLATLAAARRAEAAPTRAWAFSAVAAGVAAVITLGLAVGEWNAFNNPLAEVATLAQAVGE